jgi:hypothetical protein
MMDVDGRKENERVGREEGRGRERSVDTLARSPPSAYSMMMHRSSSCGPCFQRNAETKLATRIALA